MFINKHFSAGINTISSAESTNNLIKYWINLKRSANIKDSFIIINESNKIFILNNEVKNQKLLPKNENVINDNIILSHFKSIFSLYINEKIINQYFLGLNYILEDISNVISHIYYPNNLIRAKIISFTNNKYLCSCNFRINCDIPSSHLFAFII